jgi:hypothetical protein
MWESQRDFQRAWEGWKAGFLAFHAFHTLSFPWPALETRIGKSKLPTAPFPGELRGAKMAIAGPHCGFGSSSGYNRRVGRDGSGNPPAPIYGRDGPTLPDDRQQRRLAVHHSGY